MARILPNNSLERHQTFSSIFHRPKLFRVRRIGNPKEASIWFGRELVIGVQGQELGVDLESDKVAAVNVGNESLACAQVPMMGRERKVRN